MNAEANTIQRLISMALDDVREEIAALHYGSTILTQEQQSILNAHQHRQNMLESAETWLSQVAAWEDANSG